MIGRLEFVNCVTQMLCKTGSQTNVLTLNGTTLSFLGDLWSLSG